MAERTVRRHFPAGSKRWVRGSGVLAAACLVLVTCQGCIKVQRAAGCNNPGILGCKDKPSG